MARTAGPIDREPLLVASVRGPTLRPILTAVY